MTDFRALAGVSRTIRNLLRDRMEAPVGVTVAPPDVEVAGVAGPRLNLYLYQVKEDGYLRNQELPGTTHPGSNGFPPLSLQLNYLLTAYGSSETAQDGDLEAQLILGDAMRVLHDFPMLTEGLEITRPAVGPVGQPLLDPTLLGEFERVKITLDQATVGDFVKIWGALPQANFRRSASYSASIVQIESRRASRAALPVRERIVHVLPFERPHIDEVFREPPIGGVRSPSAEAGETLRIAGANLAADRIAVRIGAEDAQVLSVRDDQVDVLVPATLPAGLHAVRVVHDLELGNPPVAHRGYDSNAAAFQLVPRIVDIDPASAASGQLVTFELQPPMEAKQDVRLLLGDRTVRATPLAPGGPPSALAEFDLPSGADAIAPGTYLARIRVDGAESRLTVDPATQAYDGPTFTVT